MAERILSVDEEMLVRQVMDLIDASTDVRMAFDDRERAATNIVAEWLPRQLASARWAVWDEFEDQGVAPHVLNQVAQKYRIHDEPASMHSGSEEER